MKQETQKNSKGFTLLEMLVVVLIIGILAAIALPQYEMAVTKSKVAAILPVMRAFKDSLMEYKLQHGYYADLDNGIFPHPDTLGVTWPSDWSCSGDGSECYSDFWDGCIYNEDGSGRVSCSHDISDGGMFVIEMYQADEPDVEDFRGMMICLARGSQGNKVCKSLGGKFLEELEYGGGSAYKLN